MDKARFDNIGRRGFMKRAAFSAAGFLAAGAMGGTGGMEANRFARADGARGGKMIWGNLLHLGHNMWGDTPRAYVPPVDRLEFDIPLWNEITAKMAADGLNMVVIDLGEAVRYESHPELATEGAWTVDRLKEELVRLRALGLEPIPKLNFSTCHDIWLGDYSRMVSTKKYYDVCADLIAEVSEIFDRPRLFHLGYDEENLGNQETYDFIVIRKGELWWHDFMFFADTVSAAGPRPWIWSDYCIHHKEEFMERMPKSVVQSNWYYGKDFNPEENVWVKTYLDLAEAGYDQIPTGSNWDNPENFGMTVEFCAEHIPEDHLLGFLQTPWTFTLPADRDHHMAAVDQVREGKEGYARIKEGKR